MSELLFYQTKTCAFTGHRAVEKDFDYKKVETLVEKLINVGFDTFLVGMAVGFDSECFKILVKLRNKYKIRIVACIPFLGQDKRFSLAQKKDYENMLALADEKVVISKEYSDDVFKKRNQFMVENSYVLIAYLRNDKSGTASTVKIAERLGKKIFYV